MWLQTLLKELRILHDPVVRLWCDNLGSTYHSANPIFHTHTKHIEVIFILYGNVLLVGYLTFGSYLRKIT
jgi:hypothetical protein